MIIEKHSAVTFAEEDLNAALDAWAKKAFPDANARANIVYDTMYDEDSIFVEVSAMRSISGDAFNALYAETDDFTPEEELQDDGRYCILPESVSKRLILSVLREEAGFSGEDIYRISAVSGARYIVLGNVDEAASKVAEAIADEIAGSPEKVVLMVEREGKCYGNMMFFQLKEGDIVYLNGGEKVTVGEGGAHYSGDATYDGWLFYDTDGNSYFPKDM